MGLIAACNTHLIPPLPKTAHRAFCQPLYKAREYSMFQYSATTELTFGSYVSVPDGIDEQAQSVIKENANALGVTIRVK